MLVDGSVASGQRQGAPGEHQWGPGVAPSKEERAGAHQIGGLMVGAGGGGGSMVIQGRGRVRRPGKATVRSCN
jgi:hypothetical protein